MPSSDRVKRSAGKCAVAWFIPKFSSGVVNSNFLAYVRQKGDGAIDGAYR